MRSSPTRSIESLDFVLFPDGYVHAPDERRIRALSGLAMALRAPLLVGAVETRPDASERLADWQVLLHFKRDGTHNRVYTKHSTADAVAFGEPDWDPRTMLPTFELAAKLVGATICHDHYLGLLQRSLSQRGARVWVNPSYDNVTDLKWSSVLRLRAVENRSSPYVRYMTTGEEQRVPLVTRLTVTNSWLVPHHVCIDG